MGAQYRCLTGGGFGDAAMTVAKLFGSKKYRPNNTKIFHVDGNECYREPVIRFYTSQGINHEFILIDGRNGSWVLKNYKKYDSFLGTNCRALTGCYVLDDRKVKSWEIEPFPSIKFEKREVQILVNVSAGRKGSRSIPLRALKEFIEKVKRPVTLVGRTDGFHGVMFGKNVVNKINQTTIREYVNYICSAEVIISHAGFAAYLGGMAKRKVFMMPESVSDHYQHPKWNMERFWDWDFLNARAEDETLL